MGTSSSRNGEGESQRIRSGEVIQIDNSRIVPKRQSLRISIKIERPDPVSGSRPSNADIRKLSFR